MPDRQKYPRVRSPYDYYDDAIRYFRKEAEIHDRADLLSKRLRMTIRFIALEEVCQEQDIGAIPPTVMATLRLLCDFREMHGKGSNHGLKFYRPSGRSRRVIDLRRKRKAWQAAQEEEQRRAAEAAAEVPTNALRDATD